MSPATARAMTYPQCAISFNRRDACGPNMRAADARNMGIKHCPPATDHNFDDGGTMSAVSSNVASGPDLGALKAKQQVAWSTGNYAVIGTTLQIVGENLAEALDLRAGEKVLDVAAGNGNATLAAARRFCEVTSTDYVPALLHNAGERARAERLLVEFKVADAENLPFADGHFDAVMSTFGVMFTADHDRAAAQ